MPSSATDFTSFRTSERSLNNDYLLLYCKLNFTQIVNCFSDARFYTYRIHFLYAVHYNCCILMRLVSGFWSFVAY